MKKKDGFTLIEIIISFALLGIITVSILTIFNTGLVNIIRAGIRTEAVNVAEDNIINNAVTIPETEKTIVIELPTTKKNDEGTYVVNVTGDLVSGTVVLDRGSNKVEVEIIEFSPE